MKVGLILNIFQELFNYLILFFLLTIFILLNYKQFKKCVFLGEKMNNIITMTKTNNSN